MIVKLECSYVISRLLVQGVLSVNSPYARIRLKGILVIALRGSISDLDPKQLIILALSLTEYKNRFLSSLSLS